MRRAFALGLAGLLGCAHPGETAGPPPLGAGRYFPLAVGNRWSYRPAGTPSAAAEEVEIRSVHDGQYADSRGRMLWITPDGLRDQSRVILRSPVQAGRSWTVLLGPDSPEERWRILSVGNSCSAPAGTFPDCVEVESRVATARGDELVDRITFAAGVGMVRIRTTLLRGGVETPQTELLLTAFEVAPIRPPPGR
jgi:hypothetical protein